MISGGNFLCASANLSSKLGVVLHFCDKVGSFGDILWCYNNEPYHRLSSPVLHMAEWVNVTKNGFPSSLDQHSSLILQDEKYTIAMSTFHGNLLVSI